MYDAITKVSYKSDSIFRTIQWLKTPETSPDSFKNYLTKAWGNWLEVEPAAIDIVIKSTNYDPFVLAQIFVQVMFRSINNSRKLEPVYLQINIFANVEASANEFAQGEILDSPTSPPAIHLPGSHMVVWPIPNAPALCELNHIMQPEWMQSMLPTVYRGSKKGADNLKLIRYAPEHRAVLKWRLEQLTDRRNLYIKVVEDNFACASTALTLRELNAQETRNQLSFAVPSLVRYSPAWKALVMTEVPGRPFTDLIGDLNPKIYQKVGSALADVHGLLPVVDTNWSEKQELTVLCRHLLEVHRAIPDLQERLEAILMGLENRALNLPKVAFTNIHGKMFGGQIIYDSITQKIGIIDWDHRSNGDPNYDLGKLIAFILYTSERLSLEKSGVGKCLALLVAAYQQTRGEKIDWVRLEWHIAIALLIHSKILSMQKLAKGWPDHLEFAISMVEKYLTNEHFVASEIGAIELMEQSA